MVKPSPEIDELASEVVQNIENVLGVFTQLVLDLKAGRADPDRTARPHADEEGVFFSPRLYLHLNDALATRVYDNILMDLEALQVRSDALRTSIRDLVSYFLKYRFYDLSTCDIRDPKTCPKITQVFELPDGYDKLAQTVPLLVHLAEGTAAIKLIPEVITKTPWLGDRDGMLLVKSVYWLYEMGFLEFALDADIGLQGGHVRVPVIRINPSFALLDAVAQDKMRAEIETAIRSEKRRNSLVKDLGVGLHAVAKCETFKIIDSATENDVLKVATYHLRTVLAGRELGGILEARPNLEVRILCLGPTDIEELTEGAPPGSLLNSLRNGVQNFHVLRKELSSERRDKVSVRMYGDVVDDAYFRGTILCSAGGSAVVKRVLASAWPFGETRATYGELLELDGNSNTALLINNYFDRVWANSIPLPMPSRIVAVKWVMEEIRPELISAMILGIIASIVLFAKEDWGGDAFFTLVAAIALLGPAVWKVWKRAERVVRFVRTLG